MKSANTFLRHCEKRDCVEVDMDNVLVKFGVDKRQSNLPSLNS
jgi:hypothetical protein